MSGGHRIRIRALATLATAAACLAAAPSAALAVYPNSMSALGDSITRAFNTCSFPFIDCPQNSYATGTNTTVNSFYLRIRAANPAVTGNAFNDARSGARMRDLPGQATTAAGRGVEYVGIEMGANDACTSSEETMTSVASYRADFETAINNLRTRLPGARISVGSLPNIYQLWSIFSRNRSALSTWRNLGICQSMLRNAESSARADEERRQRVLQRVVEFNTVLREVCATYAQCKFDNNVGFNYRFETGDVSTRDYFHPSITGQRHIAEIEWGATWVF